MLLDLERGEDTSRPVRCDVCIVGAGPAGITMALRLAAAKIGVCLLESGGEEPEPATQKLATGVASGDPYFRLDTTRWRVFGGTTARWAGSLRRLDDADFESRPWVPHSGWPIQPEALQEYYRVALALCLPNRTVSAPEPWVDPQEPPFGLTSSETRAIARQRCDRTHFGKTYRSDVASNDCIRAYLHANLVCIETSRPATRVVRLQFRSLAGRRLIVEPRILVLACGGIENARILLNARDVEPRGLGNGNDLVGRYFMEHCTTLCGEFVPARPLPQFYSSAPPDGFSGTGIVGIKAHVRAREEILNCAVGFRPWWRQANGYESLRRIRFALQHQHLNRMIVRESANVLLHPWQSLHGVVAKLAGRPHWRPPDVVAMAVACEQAPQPDNRVTLTHDRDAIGANRARLHWRIGEFEQRTLRRATEIVARDLDRAGLGRVAFPAWLDQGDSLGRELSGSFHHMGTTRMASSPRRGVVDANCRVHGIENLYIAGTSVFPSAGFATPMLTLLALACRTADRIARELSKQGGAVATRHSV